MSEEKRLDPKALDRGMRAAFEGDSVLESIERASGIRARVLLRDAASRRPTAAAEEPFEIGGHRYEVGGELGRGGLGIVYEGRDRDLGRRVAIKVLRPEHGHEDEAIARFIEEAQVGAQLQHPGVVPVYGLGLAKGDRLYFAMKLVEGETLSELLERRDDTAEDRRLVMGIFEHVCQTMAYVHARGVIHRDLKPANVMIGSYGEVQIVDWGLAKVLGSSEPAKRASKKKASRMGSASITGAVRGTPAYMPPEQALGKVQEVDERSDVFALGAILCEILTGRPPYTGEATDPLFEAAEGRLVAAQERLAACTADPELVALCRRCLAPHREDRPRDAGVVARAIGDFLAAMEERAREAEIAVAEERARAKAERRRERQERRRAESARRARRRAVALAAVVLLAVVLGGGGYLIEADAAHRNAERTRDSVSAALRQAGRYEEAEEWDSAKAWAGKAVASARAGGADAETLDHAERVSARVERKRTAAAAAARLVARIRSILMQRSLESASTGKVTAGKFVTHELDAVALDAQYAAAFRDAGIDLQQPDQAAAAIRSLSDQEDVVMVLDGWASYRASDERLAGRGWKHLDRIARTVDPDPWRSRLRDAGSGKNADLLCTLATTANVAEQHAGNLAHLGGLLLTSERAALAVRLLRKAWHHHPDHYRLCARLADALDIEGSQAESIRMRTTAVAIRPDYACAWHGLGRALLQGGEIDAAIHALDKATRGKPDHAVHHRSLGKALAKQGRFDEAATSCRRAIELWPGFAASHATLGRVLSEQEKLDEAVATLRKAIALDPTHVDAHTNLGVALAKQGNLDAAMACFRRAIELDPGCVMSHTNLGAALASQGRRDEAIAWHRKAIELDSNCSAAHANLGLALSGQGKLDAAIASLREAIELDASFVIAHAALGNALASQGKLDAAMASFRKAIELDSSCFLAHHNLGHALHRLGKLDEAIACYRKAIELDSTCVGAHGNLGQALARQGRLDAAVASFRKAIELDSDDVLAHSDLGLVLVRQGKLDAAVASFRKAIELDPSSADRHTKLGDALRKQGNLDAAIACYREAIELDSSCSLAHHNLGLALERLGQRDEAIACYRKAIELEPSAIAHANLGDALAKQGKLDAAAASYRKAIELDSIDVPAHTCLGLVLAKQGKLDEAIEAFRRAVHLEPAASRRGHAQALQQRFGAALPAVLQGAAPPADAAERLGLAEACYYARRYEDAVRLFKLAFAADPKARRYLGACAAVLAGEKHYALAREWLRRDLPTASRAALKEWQRGDDLVDVDPKVNDDLPPAERKAWQAFWAEVQALREGSER